MVFGNLGIFLGFVLERTEPMLGALLGMILGVSIAEITHMIDSARK
jgi:hypothetical protein